MLQLTLKNPGIIVLSLYRSFERAFGVKVAFCSSVVEEVVGPGGAIARPLSMLKNALVKGVEGRETYKALLRSTT